MSENKFIAKLKGEPTPKSVVEIQNDRLVAPFKSSPMGHIADRDSSVVVAKGAQNWAVNQGQLVPVADDYVGTESDLSGTSRVSGAGLWLNATYTFPATGDETNPVSAIIAPSAKWVLTLCGDSLITQNGSVITLTMLVKIGATHLTTKQFKVRECASQFSQRLAIDFSESEQSVIKAHGGSPLTVQVLCDDEGASATIYSGMTHLTLLQRKIDADLVATDNVLLPEFIENLLEGYIIPADYFSNYEYLEQVEDGGKAMPEFTRNGDNMNFTGWAKPATEVYTKTEIDDKFAVANAQIDANADAIQKTREDYVKKSGDTMTGDLVMSSDEFNTKAKLTTQGATGRTTLKVSSVDNESVSASFEFDYAGNFVVRHAGIGGENMGSLGSKDVPVKYVYAKRLNSADGDNPLGDRERDLIVPSVGGTLARIEDLDAREQEIRDDVNQVDSELQSQITAQAGSITTLRNDTDDLGDQVANIESKIPDGTSDTNPLINKQQLLDEEMDIREDLNSGLSELQTQITAQAAEIAKKQDELIAGDNIVISGNVISATGAGGGAGFDIVVVQELPATGQKGIIYLLAKDGTAPDVYDEYVWIETTQTFELIGTTQVDLTDYAKKEELDNYLPLAGGEMTGAITFSDTEYSVSHNTPYNGLTIYTSSSRGFVFTNSNYSSIHPTSNGGAELGQSAYRWRRIYATKLNNGADIAIPTTGGTIALAENIEQTVTTQNLTVGSGEGTLYIGDVAGTATIATNNGLDIAAQTKFDTAPTTDDNTTYANALDTSLVRKAQVATAIADAVANIDALPDQTGNAGKVLTTDGTTASWQEPAGGTKVIFREWE